MQMIYVYICLRKTNKYKVYTLQAMNISVYLGGSYPGNLSQYQL